MHTAGHAITAGHRQSGAKSRSVKSTLAEFHTVSATHAVNNAHGRPQQTAPHTPLTLTHARHTTLTHARPSNWHARNQAQSKQEQSMRVSDKLRQHLCATYSGSHDDPAR